MLTRQITAACSKASQNPIIVGQGAYNSAYGTTFQNNGPLAGLVQIFDFQFTFKTLTGATLTMPLTSKAIQDEMGEAFDPEYGRMSGNLGVEVPNAQAGTQQNLILYPFVNPATEIFQGIQLPPGVEVTPIAIDQAMARRSGRSPTTVWTRTRSTSTCLMCN